MFPEEKEININLTKADFPNIPFWNQNPKPCSNKTRKNKEVSKKQIKQSKKSRKINRK